MTLSLTCECKSWEFRQYCRHTTLIAKLVETGATFAFPFTVQSSRDPRRTYRVESVGLVDAKRTNPPS